MKCIIITDGTEPTATDWTADAATATGTFSGKTGEFTLAEGGTLAAGDVLWVQVTATVKSASEATHTGGGSDVESVTVAGA